MKNLEGKAFGELKEGLQEDILASGSIDECTLPSRVDKELGFCYMKGEYIVSFDINEKFYVDMTIVITDEGVVSRKIEEDSIIQRNFSYRG